MIIFTTKAIFSTTFENTVKMKEEKPNFCPGNTCDPNANGNASANAKKHM